MKRLFLVLSVAILLSFLYIIVMNTGNSIDVNILYSHLLDAQTKAGWTEQSAYFTKTIKLSTYTLLTILSGIFVGAGIVYMFLSAQKDKTKAYQRELEKTSISGINNASKVEVLEAKIKTLEKAFETVIDERKKLEIQIENLNLELENINKNKDN